LFLSIKTHFECFVVVACHQKNKLFKNKQFLICIKSEPLLVQEVQDQRLDSSWLNVISSLIIQLHRQIFEQRVAPPIGSSDLDSFSNLSE